MTKILKNIKNKKRGAKAPFFTKELSKRRLKRPITVSRIGGRDRRTPRLILFGERGEFWSVPTVKILIISRAENSTAK